MNRRLVVGLVVIGIAVAIAVWLRSRRSAEVPEKSRISTGSAEAGASTGSATARPTPGPMTRVRRLPAEERRQLGAQIEAARARGRAERASAGGAGGAAVAVLDDTISLEQVGPKVQAAFQEAIPILAVCYGDKPAGATAVVTMTMTSDPDLGSVIDTDAMLDQDGKPLAPELDDCLRTAIESLVLPPLEVGGRLPLQYSFLFD